MNMEQDFILLDIYFYIFYFYIYKYKIKNTRHIMDNLLYEGWTFNFGNTPLDWIQELLE